MELNHHGPEISEKSAARLRALLPAGDFLQMDDAAQIDFVAGVRRKRLVPVRVTKLKSPKEPKPPKLPKPPKPPKVVKEKAPRKPRIKKPVTPTAESDKENPA